MMWHKKCSNLILVLETEGKRPLCKTSIRWINIQMVINSSGSKCDDSQHLFRNYLILTFNCINVQILTSTTTVALSKLDAFYKV